MNVADVSLPEVLLLTLGGIAAGSLILPAIGLVTAWALRRRSLPLRHGLLLATLGVVSLLPVLIPWWQSRGCGWDIRSEQTDTLQTMTSIPPTFRQGVANSSTLELPTDGSLETEGMTVAEVMARYGASTAPAASTFTPPMPTHESEIRVRRLIALIGSLLVLAWLAGSGLSLLRAIRAGRTLRRLTQRAEPIRALQIIAMLAGCARDAGVGRLPSLVGSADAAVPYVSGLLRPSIVLPASLVAADEPTLRGILLHELAHIRRRDLWVGLGQRLVAALYWWNPLVHRLNSRLAEMREDLCDNYVLAHISDPRDYAQTLVDLASQAAAARVVPSMGLLTRNPNRLSGRIQRILQEDRPMATRLGGVSKVLLMVFVFALGVASTLFVIRLPDILPESRATAPAVSDAEPVAVDSRSERTISLVRHDAGASMGTSEPANWDVVVFPPIATSDEAAAAKADVAEESADLFVPTGNSLPPTVPDLAPPEAFAGHTEPLAQGPLPSDFSAPPSARAFPLESPPSDAAPFASEPQPAADDPFSAPPAVELPRPAIAGEAPPLGGTAAPAPPKALVLVELIANADGSVKQLRYLTEELGNDDAAFQKLEQQIVAWAGQNAGGDLTVQIVADPQLRFEHVSRVMNLCSPMVTRVLLAKPETNEQVTITVGFVRDGEGRPLIATPVVFWQDEVVRLGELQARLEAWQPPVEPVEQGALAPPVDVRRRRSDYTVVLHCDGNVDYTVVETIMKAARQAGFEHFRITAIDGTEVAVEPVRGTVLEIDNESRTVHVSYHPDNGLRPGEVLSVERPSAAGGKAGPVIARVEVAGIEAAVVECRIIEEDLLTPIMVGDLVRTAGRRAAPIAKPGPAAF